MAKFVTKIVFLGLLLLLESCENDIIDWYLGVPLQPKFEEDSFHEGLNLFSVIRPDFQDSLNKTFAYVEEIQRATEYTEFKTLDSAIISLYKLTGNEIIDTFPLIYTNNNGAYADTLFRPSDSFYPVAGEKYRIECSYPGLVTAIGTTTIPAIPVIEESSLQYTSTNLQFTWLPDSSIKMIDVYLIINSNSSLLARYLPGSLQPVDFNFQLSVNSSGYKLRIYAYDANLTVYYSNSNTSLNFNKYRVTYSTLSSGYGVFGSINFADFVFE